MRLFRWFSTTVIVGATEVSCQSLWKVMSHQINVWGGVTMCIIYCGWLAKYFHSLFSSSALQHKGNQLSDVGDLSTSSWSKSFFSTSAVAQNIFPTCHNLPSCFIDNLCAHTHTHCIHGRQQEERKPFFPPYTISAQILLFILTRMNDSLFSPLKV